MKFGAGGRPHIGTCVETVDFGAKLWTLAPFFSNSVFFGQVA